MSTCSFNWRLWSRIWILKMHFPVKSFATNSSLSMRLNRKRKWKINAFINYFFPTNMYKLLLQSEMEQICALKIFKALIATKNFPCMMTCYTIKRHSKLTVSIISLLSLEWSKSYFYLIKEYLKFVKLLYKLLQFEKLFVM